MKRLLILTLSLILSAPAFAQTFYVNAEGAYLNTGIRIAELSDAGKTVTPVTGHGASVGVGVSQVMKRRGHREFLMESKTLVDYAYVGRIAGRGADWNTLYVSIPVLAKYRIPFGHGSFDVAAGPKASLGVMNRMTFDGHTSANAFDEDGIRRFDVQAYCEASYTVFKGVQLKAAYGQGLTDLVPGPEVRATRSNLYLGIIYQL